jgi:D-alanyl-D-alanine carboxypeptidase
MNELKIGAYMEEAVYGGLPNASGRVMGVLGNIDSTKGSSALPYKLLAVRKYLRNGDAGLVANWTWSESEFSTRMSQEPTKTLYAEAGKAQSAFASANGGYSLAISPLRSLAKQVALWCGNDGIFTAGQALVAAADKELQKPLYPDTCTTAAMTSFVSFLKAFVPNPEPSNAAPGTSDHGRGVAVDFVVLQGSKTIADTTTATIDAKWTRPGWTTKLKAATAGTKLKGPLQSPYEPWHWSL